MIKYLIMDVDGTLTDGKINIGPVGEVMKSFSIKDGCGIHDILPQKKITPIIITGRQSAIVEKRCKELGITEIHQGVRDKEFMMMEILKTLYGSLSEVAYIGDDLPDLPCMEAVKKANGLIGCPFDACDEVIQIADYVSQKKGGEGAVRDFIEWIVKKN